ncbi:MAG: hypothetical protein HYY16_06655 [Planctomycetes bacterium]|nr:hypothetical protein [Planctomycetota bacterium]
MRLTAVILMGVAIAGCKREQVDDPAEPDRWRVIGEMDFQPISNFFVLAGQMHALGSDGALHIFADDRWRVSRKVPLRPHLRYVVCPVGEYGFVVVSRTAGAAIVYVRDRRLDEVTFLEGAPEGLDGAFVQKLDLYLAVGPDLRRLPLMGKDGSQTVASIPPLRLARREFACTAESQLIRIDPQTLSWQRLGAIPDAVDDLDAGPDGTILLASAREGRIWRCWPTPTGGLAWFPPIALARPSGDISIAAVRNALYLRADSVLLRTDL